MFTRMPIRKKIVCGTVMLASMLLLLFGCSLRGFYAYRELVKTISTQAAELPQVDMLAKEVDKLRLVYQPDRYLRLRDPFSKVREQLSNDHFITDLRQFHERVKRYVLLLRGKREQSPWAYSAEDLQLARTIETKVTEIIDAVKGQAYIVNPNSAEIENDLYELSEQVHELPAQMHRRMAALRDDVRYSYRTWYGFMVISACASFMLIGIAYVFFRRSVVQPFKELLAGTRLIAKGNFEHRILLASGDELSELAHALNAMTARFVEIRDHLNEKVQERTREVVRSEQLASVGFLAAGVAHEINNPLASIAWSAEALESRLHEILHDAYVLEAAAHAHELDSINAGSADRVIDENAETGKLPVGQRVFDPDELNVLRKYLKRIQDEAFRCKGITERLLDFSRWEKANVVRSVMSMNWSAT